MSTTETPRLWDTQDVADFLGKGESTIRRMRTSNEGPPYMVIGRSIRYIPGSVRRWAEATQLQTRQGTK